MRSTAATFRKHSSAGVDWASWFLGIGLGLTLALQVTTMRQSDISSVYAVVASVSRFAALTGTYFATVGIFLVSRIPWVERGVGHDRLVTWHRKLGPWSLYLIGAHIIDPHSGLIAIGAKSATVIGPDGGLADAMATALMVAGDDGSQWFGREELHEYSAWVIERNDGGAWGVGPLITAR
jgi:hypothetical protein